MWFTMMCSYLSDYELNRKLLHEKLLSFQPGGYHLEDIDSDDDSLLQENSGKKLSKSPTPVPIDSPTPSSPPASPRPAAGVSKPSTSKEEPQGSVGGPPMPSKEELLMMMEKVDRDIATAETQISALEKKRVCVLSLSCVCVCVCVLSLLCVCVCVCV